MSVIAHLPYPHIAGSVSDCPGCDEWKREPNEGGK